MPAPTRQSVPPQRGFTFIEVMFAVLVLGVGVVMVATMLPVAIKTVQETRESVAATGAIESGFHQVEQAYFEGGTVMLPNPQTVRQATYPTAPSGGLAVGRPWTYPALDSVDPTWFPAFSRTFGNRVGTADPTIMWLPFYARFDDVDPPQVAMVAVRARNIEAFPTSANPSVPGASAYDGLFDANNIINADGSLAGSPGSSNTGPIKLSNYPLPITISTLGGTTFEDGASTGQLDLQLPDLIRMEGRGPVTNRQVREAAVEGAAVVAVDALGRLRVYRLAAPYDEAADGDPTATTITTWQLQLDAGLSPDFVVNAPANVPNPGDDNANNDFSADALNGGADFGDYADFADGSITQAAPIAEAYLIGRMLQNPSYASTSSDANGWDADDNPHVGPSPVAGVLDGTKLR